VADQTYRDGFGRAEARPDHIRPGRAVLAGRWVLGWVDRNIAIVFNIPTVAVLAGLVVIPRSSCSIRASPTGTSISATSGASSASTTTSMPSATRAGSARSSARPIRRGAVILQFVIGFAIALLLNQEFKGNKIYRSIFMLPMLAMTTAISLVWLILYNSSFGPFNYWLVSAGLPSVNWLGDPRWAMPSLIAVQVWQWTPFMTLLLLAGLQSLPREPYEAARLDGASAFQSFIHVTLPLMRGHIVVALVLRSIIEIKEFDSYHDHDRGRPERRHRNHEHELLSQCLLLRTDRHGRRQGGDLLFPDPSHPGAALEGPLPSLVLLTGMAMPRVRTLVLHAASIAVIAPFAFVFVFMVWNSFKPDFLFSSPGSGCSSRRSCTIAT
jgi:multiple sugar transport system permease protein